MTDAEVRRFAQYCVISQVTEHNGSPCVIWEGGASGKPARATGESYGGFQFRGKNRKAHRVAYEAMFGQVAEGLVLDHLCRQRRCVNPYHLEPVTSGENSRRGNTGAHMRKDGAR